jgi:hypothetical protein
MKRVVVFLHTNRSAESGWYERARTSEPVSLTKSLELTMVVEHGWTEAVLLQPMKLWNDENESTNNNLTERNGKTFVAILPSGSIP